MSKCALAECSTLTDNPKFCSLSCSAKHQAKSATVRVSVKACQWCSNYFDVTSRNPEKVYCSRSCAAKVNNSLRARSRRACARCGDEIGSAGKKFCSTNCAGLFKREEKIRLWKDGEWDGSVGQGLSKTIKDYLIKEAGNKCSLPTCAVPGGFSDVNPTTGKVPLEVDHIDGDAYNNRIENLVVLCPNCHSLTPTYRALNRNGSRAYRTRQ